MAITSNFFYTEEAWLSRKYNNKNSILTETIKNNDFVYENALQDNFNELKELEKVLQLL